MFLSASPENLPFFEALASDVRIHIIALLAEKDMNIKELADEVGISSPMMIKHIGKLEQAGIVTTRLVKRNGAIHKICTLVFAEYRLGLHSSRRSMLPAMHVIPISVGHYFDINGTPTCGLATEDDVVGFRDDPRAFYLPERVNAHILWFTQGYVEYRVPNQLSAEHQPTEIEISFEIASEAPDFADDWPSDITIHFNGVKLCTWTSPGDYGLKRGLLTPEWWNSNQYGLLKVIRILNDGVLLDGEKVSDVTLNQVLKGESINWSLRFEVAKNAANVGGLTLYGKKFGNHAQDIIVRTFYIGGEDTSDPSNAL